MNNLVTIFVVGMSALIVCIVLSIQLSHKEKQVIALTSQIEFLKAESEQAQKEAVNKHDSAVANLNKRQRSVDALMKQSVANDCHAAIAWALSQKEGFLQK